MLFSVCMVDNKFIRVNQQNTQYSVLIFILYYNMESSYILQSTGNYHQGIRIKSYRIKLNWLLCVQLPYSVQYQVIKCRQFRNEILIH
jgi:hypothetical protein